MINKIFVLLVTLFLNSSCNKSTKIINQIDNDSNLIFNSAKELIENYDSCITELSDTSTSTIHLKRVFCTISNDNVNLLKTDDFHSTFKLINKGYKIKLDAENYYRIFFEHSAIEHIAGFNRFGVLYNKQEYTVKKVFSLNLNNIDTLKTISDYFHIVKISEYAE